MTSHQASGRPKVKLGKGTIVGITHTERRVSDFRGIPYARPSKRFGPPEKLGELPSDPFDASAFGPKSPQTADRISTVLPKWLLQDLKLPSDEFNCLNLNVSTPTSALNGKARLPVMVWLHGGAFSFGAASYGLYSLRHLVSKSEALGTPIVAVSVNFRSNYFGFLASKEVEEDPDAVLNAGLLDQRAALEWVQENITSFGGDPSRVTLFGQSSGSLSVHAHMLAGIPLFQRAILQSGVLAETLGPRTLGPEIQKQFDDLTNHLNIKHDKVNGLRALKARVLIDAIESVKGPFPFFAPVDDSHLKNGFFKAGKSETHGWLWHSSNPQWCPEIIIGDCQVEGIIYSGVWSSLDKSIILNPLHKLFPDEILSLYSLDAKSTADKALSDFSKNIVAFLTDIRFVASIARMEKEYPGKVYAYHFDRGNPFEVPLKGIAHHGIDLFYCFGVYEEHLTEKADKDILNSVIASWTGFAHGKPPWEEIEVSGRRRHFEKDGSIKLSTREEIPTRNWKALDLLADHVDASKIYGMALVNSALTSL